MNHVVPIGDLAVWIGNNWKLDGSTLRRLGNVADPARCDSTVSTDSASTLDGVSQIRPSDGSTRASSVVPTGCELLDVGVVGYGLFGRGGIAGALVATIGLAPIALAVWGHCLLEPLAPRSQPTA